jgi:GGDEF domain-containing protein
MKNQLKAITNKTITEVLSDEIILPSTYFEKFNKNARILKVDLEDENFENKISDLIVQEFNTIEDYMKLIEKNTSSLKELTNESKKAIKNKDLISLNESYIKIENLENEIKELTLRIYKDNLTNTYNKKWFYNQYLNGDSCFKNDAEAVLVSIKDFEYIKNEYGKLIVDNLLMFVIKFLNEHFIDSKEHLGEPFDKYNILRYYDDKFIVFVEEKEHNKINNLFFNIRELLSSTTLKSSSGLLIKANFDYSICPVKKGQNSKTLIENLFS